VTANGKVLDCRHVVPYNPFLLLSLRCHVNVVVLRGAGAVFYCLNYVHKGPDKANVEFRRRCADHINFRMPQPVDPTAIINPRSRADMFRANLFIRQGGRGRGRGAPQGPNSSVNQPAGRGRGSVTVANAASDPTPSTSTASVNNATGPDGRIDDEAGSNQFMDYDEILAAQEMRFITATEAHWTVTKKPLYQLSAKVLPLSVHLEGEQPVCTTYNRLERRYEQGPPRSTLTAYFEAVNDVTKRTTDITYSEMHKHFTWDRSRKVWNPRKIARGPLCARMYEVNPRRGDLFYLRALLKVVTDKGSFEAVRTVNGVLHGTFKEAAAALGLLREDAEYWR